MILVLMGVRTTKGEPAMGEGVRASRAELGADGERVAMGEGTCFACFGLPSNEFELPLRENPKNLDLPPEAVEGGEFEPEFAREFNWSPTSSTNRTPPRAGAKLSWSPGVRSEFELDDSELVDEPEFPMPGLAKGRDGGRSGVSDLLGAPLPPSNVVAKRDAMGRSNSGIGGRSGTSSGTGGGASLAVSDDGFLRSEKNRPRPVLVAFLPEDETYPSSVSYPPASVDGFFSFFFGFGGLDFALTASSASVSAPLSFDGDNFPSSFLRRFFSSLVSATSSIGSPMAIVGGGASLAVLDLVRTRAFLPPSLTYPPSLS